MLLLLIGYVKDTTDDVGDVSIGYELLIELLNACVLEWFIDAVLFLVFCVFCGTASESIISKSDSSKFFTK